MQESTGLLLSSAIAFLSFLVNLSYWVVHSNGKKYIRLLTSVVMLYFSVILFMLGTGVPTGYSGHSLVRDWLSVLFLIPVWDLIVDWKQKTQQKKLGREKS
jgi:hypothetical protein